MSEIFEFQYSWEEYVKFNRECELNYISYDSLELRANPEKRISDLNKISKVNHFRIMYNYELDSFNVEGNQKNYELASETIDLFGGLNRDIPTILDITSMNIRVLGTFLHSMKHLEFKTILCVYCEPYRYVKAPLKEEDCFRDAFQLYKHFKGVSPIPGYVRANDKNLEEKMDCFFRIRR